MQLGPIWIIDDDSDDHEMVQEVFDELKLENSLVFFNSAAEVLKRIDDVQESPFIIICDVNLPKMDGFQLRAALLANPSPKSKSVPFIFWSSHASSAQITKAYQLSAHGFFIKETSLSELKQSFIKIIQYWQTSKMPPKNIEN